MPAVQSGDGEFDQPVIEQQDVARRHVEGEPLVGARDPLGVPDETARLENDVGPALEHGPRLHLPDPDFRSPEIEQDRDRSSEFLGELSNPRDHVGEELGIRVTRVQPDYVDPGCEQRTEPVGRGRTRSESGHNAGSSSTT
jgi:hypothetical protein